MYNSFNVICISLAFSYELLDKYPNSNSIPLQDETKNVLFDMSISWCRMDSEIGLQIGKA